MNDPWIAPYSIKIMHDFLDEKYYSFLNNIIQQKNFYPAKQGIGKNQLVQEKHKIRLDYTLNSYECSFIDKPLINKADCNCTLRERWRLLYYDGDNDKKAFRDAHTDWTSYSCHRRMSIIIGLSNPSDYVGGELVFPKNNLKYKIEKGAAVIFDGRLLHEVLPVTKGKRYVLQAFLFDETGWQLKKVKNGKKNFILLEQPKDIKKNINLKVKKNINEYENWDIYKKNMIHSRVSHYNENYIGTYKHLNDVINYLKQHPNKIYFGWHTDTHSNPKWRGRAYAWDINTCRMKGRLNPSSWPAEHNVISGMFKRSNKNKSKPVENIPKTINKTLSLISTDGGPGNQIVGIKEGLLMSKMLDREFIFPPIIQHYTLNRTNRGNINNIKYWKFNEVFNYDNKKNKELVDNLSLLQNSTNIYCTRHTDIKNSLRMEKILNINCPKTTISKKQFRNKTDYKFLRESDHNLFISHLYNNTAISKCFWNGCDICGVNKEFIEDYKDICRNFDYSDKIKTIGKEFIKNTFNNEPFISLHLRYHDSGSLDSKKTKELHQNIELLLNKLIDKHNIKPNNVFIATNKQKLVNNSILSKYSMLSIDSKHDELESFIEQYICCKSLKFIYTGGDLCKPEHKHLRSTWTSFVLDYRYCILGKNKIDHIYLTNYFNNSDNYFGYHYN